MSEKGSGFGCMKLLLTIFIIAQLVLGVTILSVCIWAFVDDGQNVTDVGTIIGTSLYKGSIQAALTISCMIIMQCITGFVGVYKENRCALAFYSWSIIFQLLAIFGAAIAAIVLQATLETIVLDGLTGTLRDDYASNTAVTNGWDIVQQKLECCGVKGDKADWTATLSWNAYRTSVNFINNANGYLVPESCCVKNNGAYTDLQDCTGLTQNVATSPPVSSPPNATNPHLHMGGCYTSVYDSVVNKALVVGIFGVITALVLIFAVIFACRISSAIKEECCNNKTV